MTSYAHGEMYDDMGKVLWVWGLMAIKKWGW